MNNKTILKKELYKCFSNEMVLLHKSLNYHWNLKGSNFLSLHEFFKKMYENFLENIDNFAEKIRQMNFFIPQNTIKLLKFSDIKFVQKIENQNKMCLDILHSLEIQYKRYYSLFNILEYMNNQEMMDFITQRMADNRKFHWMLRSTLNI
ncbi:MAG: ferritin-like domain-containing protein [Candidatus Dojkabacteria bacterium]|nr:ferritin-like domain-containing protein [Candidatus Dojkabacteria bacterium]